MKNFKNNLLKNLQIFGLIILGICLSIGVGSGLYEIGEAFGVIGFAIVFVVLLLALIIAITVIESIED